MVRPTRMRKLVGVLKDKLSLIKATLLLSTSFHLVAVIRATTHHPTEPPPDYTVEDVLAFGHHHRPTATALVDALLSRLHRTHSAYVALKCLLTLHHILARGSPVLKDQISCGPHLQLSTFRDGSDADTWELSSWVRWYAGVIEQSLIVSHVLGFYLSSSSSSTNQIPGEKISGNSVTNLLKKLNSLTGMMEQIRRAPDSLHYQRISLIYEVMKLVGEDYRMILREIFRIINELGRRIDDLNHDGLKELLDDLKRVEDCKEKLFLMFLNKKKNDGVWDLIAQLRRDVEVAKERRESTRLVRFQGSGSTRLEGNRVRESNSLAVVPVPSGKR